MRPVAVLFARADSIYKSLPGCDVWDAERDARRWPGGAPVVAHPPCKRWSSLNGVVLSRYAHKADEFAWGNDGGLFELALECVRRWGGVIEHPAGSRAFAHFGLPRRGRTPDRFGGWVTEIRQCDWGHRAEKRTWLYVVGAEPDDVPPIPARREPSMLVMRMRHQCRQLPYLRPAEKEHTPPELACWLVELARRTTVLRAAA